MSPPTDLAARCAATQTVIERFRDRAFSWTARRTCIHLARAQMVAMGHRPPRLPDMRSALAARRALVRTGHEDLAGLLDSLVPRIAPAAMWVGDLALMPGDDALGAIVVNVGGLVMGYHEEQPDAGLVNILPVGERPFVAAWRL